LIKRRWSWKLFWENLIEIINRAFKVNFNCLNWQIKSQTKNNTHDSVTTIY
jgi:hypothetical protein